MSNCERDDWWWTFIGVIVLLLLIIGNAYVSYMESTGTGWP